MNNLTNYQFRKMVENNLNTELSGKNDVKVIMSIYKLLKKSNGVQELLTIRALINKYVNYADCKDFYKLTNSKESVGKRNIVMTCGEIKVSVMNALDYLCQDSSKIEECVEDASWAVLRREVKDLLSTPEYSEVR